MHYVYILKGSRYYIGYTSNLEKRLQKHIDGRCQTTIRIKPYELIGFFEKSNKDDAIKLEKIIKKNGHIQHRINHETFIKVNKKIT